MIPLNQQPAEKFVLNEGGALDVVKVWRTMQGEGPDVGTPAVFVRLAGCDLECPGCDTDYTTGRRVVDMLTLSRRIMIHVGDTHKLVVLTGGEPFRQNVGPLVSRLLHNGCRVQVETNGTLPPPSITWDYNWAGDRVSIICSPKAAKIDNQLQSRITAYKYVLRYGDVDEKDGLPTGVLGNGVRVARPDWNFVRLSQVFVQPEDQDDATLNGLNLQAAYDSSQRFGFRLSLQAHKIIGVE